MMMMDDSAPTNKRRKLVRTYKNVLPWKQVIVAEVCRETYSKEKMIKRWSRKTATDINDKNNPVKQKGTLRERERAPVASSCAAVMVVVQTATFKLFYFIFYHPIFWMRCLIEVPNQSSQWHQLVRLNAFLVVIFKRWCCLHDCLQHSKLPLWYHASDKCDS